MKIMNNVGQIDAVQWSKLVVISSTANFFQTKECFDFFDSLPMFSAFIYGVADDKGVLRGVCSGYIQSDGGKIKRFLSRRAIINGGPMFADDITEKELLALLKAVREGLKGRAIYVETRNYNDYSKYRHVFEKAGYIYEPHLNFHVDTTSEEVVIKNIHKNKKRKIRSTLKENVVVDECPSKEDLKSFYLLLSELYKNKVKTPLLPLSFFEKLYDQEFSKFLIIKKDKEVLGGQVILILPQDTVYLFFLCGEDGKYKGIYPSVLGTYAGIEFSVKNGCKKCDMLGAGKPDEEYGVRNFKAEFGGQLVEHGRYDYVLSPMLYKVGKMGVKIMKSNILTDGLWGAIRSLFKKLLRHKHSSVIDNI